ncbi:MAG: T9SS type A sorting domain-containing protein [Cyclobacteriaceae bacterium]|nr:T9SS type A sorting domain-containing protein [Cyclobacteriaceae bacterium]
MKRITHTFSIMLLLGILHFHAKAQIELVADLAPGTESEVIGFENEWDENLFILGDQLLFILRDHPLYGTELWRMGTDEQITLVKDLQPGLGGGLENTTIMLFNNLAYFLGKDSNGVHSLYQTDGTSEGTVVVKELYDSEIENLSSHHVVNGKLLFHISISEGQRDLWVTDGTADGTEILTANINVGDAINIGNQALVSGYDEIHGNELWVTDGTEAGTHLFKELNPGTENGDPYNFYKSSIGIFFQGNTVAEGRELWMTDGTVEGTVLVKDIRDDSPGNGSNPHDFTELDGIIFFTADNALWKTDGTELGTELVVSGDPNNPEYLFAYDGELYFNAQGGSNVFFELYKTDGSTTTLVKDINTPSNSSSPKAHFIIGDTHYFFAYDNTATGLWTTDGTEEGTTLIKHLYDGSLFPANIKSESNPTLFNGNYYFNISNQLWRTDGTEVGTVEINHSVNVPIDSSPLNFIETPLGTFFAAFVNGDPHLFVTDGDALTDLSEAGFVLNGEPEEINSDFIFYNNKLIFSGYTAEEGEEPWITDGTLAGTHLIKDVNTFDLFGGAREFFEFNEKVYFRAKNAGSNDFELFVTDGTEGGTSLVKDINTGIQPSHPNGFGIIGDKMYFEAFTTTYGSELWETDGTEEGTKLVVDLRAGNPGAIHDVQAYYFGKVFFTAYVSAGVGTELYFSDGTELGTGLLYEIGPGGNTGGIQDGTFIKLPTKLVFTANDGTIWSTEGTPETTFQILNEEYTATTSYRYSVGVINEKYVFVAQDNEDDTHYIFATDGTIENTVALASGFTYDDDNIYELSNGRYLYSAEIDGKLYFTTGFGIHSTDGTVAGTSYFGEGKNGTSFNALYPATLNGKLYFTGFEEGSTTETLFVSDGTSSGTQALDNGGVAVKGLLQPIADYLYFAGYDFEFGQELYRFNTTLETQQITFNSIEDQFLEAGTLTLSANASSGLPVSFSVVSGPVTLSGNILSFTGLGVVTVSASQAGNNQYFAASPVEQSFEIISVTGLERESSPIIIYPNPATDVLTIQTEQRDVFIKLFNIHGGEVMDIQPNVGNRISHLANGIYIVRISGTHGFTSRKIIKK